MIDNLHDEVIGQIIKHLNQKDYNVYTNPGQEKNASINGNYPDVVMTEKNGTTVKFILEIETADSVTEKEAEQQWKKYADEIKASFYIVVPSGMVAKAKEYCVKYNINARFASYNVGQNDVISFNFNV